jgi:hypothetical protein
MRDEIQKLRAALARREGGRGKRFSPELRQRIADVARQLRDDGQSWTRISDALGVPMGSVRRLGDGEAAGFTAVELVDDAGARGLVVVTPTGFRVEGLTPAAAVALIRKLS